MAALQERNDPTGGRGCCVVQGRRQEGRARERPVRSILCRVCDVNGHSWKEQWDQRRTPPHVLGDVSPKWRGIHTARDAKEEMSRRMHVVCNPGTV
jgi:hypothetical protein